MNLTVAELESMDRADLIAAWAKVFKGPVPKRLSSPFLRRFLAFECQARERGGLPNGFAGKLARAQKHHVDGGHTALASGGRLIREWNVITHVVDVVDGGFLWKGQHFTSLSPIAREITGARWSGPRFFGLKRST